PAPGAQDLPDGIGARGHSCGVVRGSGANRPAFGQQCARHGRRQLSQNGDDAGIIQLAGPISVAGRGADPHLRGSMTFPTIPQSLGDALVARGYVQPPPVQAAVLEPDAAGRDLIVSAQTGSGKTVAFGLAMASELMPDGAAIMPG